MTARSARRGPAVLLAAVGGVLLGHWLTYRIVAPLDHARDALLDRTGHGYLAFANDAALVLALGGLAAIFLGRLVSRRAEPLPPGALVARLVAFQAGAFVAMETAERLTAGSSPVELVHHGLLPAGVAVQALVALGTALVVRLLLRAADAVATLLDRPAPLADRAVVVAPLPRGHAPVRSLARSAWGSRGPPSPSS
jgi:hypothetical protein